MSGIAALLCFWIVIGWFVNKRSLATSQHRWLALIRAIIVCTHSVRSLSGPILFDHCLAPFCSIIVWTHSVRSLSGPFWLIIVWTHSVRSLSGPIQFDRCLNSFCLIIVCTHSVRSLSGPILFDHCLDPFSSIIVWTHSDRSLSEPILIDHCLDPFCSIIGWNSAECWLLPWASWGPAWPSAFWKASGPFSSDSWTGLFRLKKLVQQNRKRMRRRTTARPPNTDTRIWKAVVVVVVVVVVVGIYREMAVVLDMHIGMQSMQAEGEPLRNVIVKKKLLLHVLLYFKSVLWIQIKLFGSDS